MDRRYRGGSGRLPGRRCRVDAGSDGHALSVPDSHLNAYVRFKLALTEDQPTIKPYDEARWAELSDTRTVAPAVSLDLLESLHARWVGLLRALAADDYRRTFHHPEHGRPLTLDEVLGMYAWHGQHHVAHITSLRRREGW